MKKSILALVVVALLPIAAVAGPNRDRDFYNHRPHHHHHHRGHGHWVAPLIIGGIVGAAITHANATPVVVNQTPPVVVQNGQAICGHTVPCEVVLPQTSPCKAVEVPVRDQSGRILEFRLVCQ